MAGVGIYCPIALISTSHLRRAQPAKSRQSLATRRRLRMYSPCRPHRYLTVPQISRDASGGGSAAAAYW
ncbi:unnamed protein product, partial [Brenthis ino]